jgi:4-carboxymuconolactone decarboxylase
MRILLLIALTFATVFAQPPAVAAKPAPAAAKPDPNVIANLPKDVDHESFSRLPMIKREQLSGKDLETYDAVIGKDQQGNPRPTPPLGPAATSLYSMGVALPMDQLNKFIRVVKIGPAMYQLGSSIAAREIDEPYEWQSHAPAAVRAGISQKTIDAIKYDRELTPDIPEKEALVVHFGRALFRDHKVSPELYAKVVKEFGQEGMFELTSVMADYAMAAYMLRAVDQHWPQGPVDLPEIKKTAR